MRDSRWKALLVVLVGSALGFLVGCADMEYVSNGRFFFYHKELPAAQRAIDAARAAGRDRECPAEFKAAEKLKDDAYATYYACHTQEAIAMANEAIAKANALCPRAEAPPAPPAPPPPAPPAAPAPTVSLSSGSSSINAGACTNLSWTTSNARSASIDQGIGSVETSGSRQVCPTTTTRYTLTAIGDGGSRADSTTVSVAAKPAAPIDRMTLHVNFDTNKYEIRKADLAEMKKAAAFVRKYDGATISIQGYTDSTGTPRYNQGLSERRADAVRRYLVENGAAADDKITSEGHGESNPIASNKTVKGRAQNRRVEVLILSR
ncbi:MAG TPA: OmpA family protein [Thermoanaerobaculia bacterium]|jgi:outer membrane protein OmpA-like peptidoglycan-associated protein|nr:OmpA family protein [Thermoanaerobaculia bacterium]